MKILVLGVSGMIVSAVFSVLIKQKDWRVIGSIRDPGIKSFFSASMGESLESGVDVENIDSLTHVLDRVRPNIVVNCAGLTKHKPLAEDPLASIPINTLMPHKLARLCGLIGARLIHISTDCVFSGEKGLYTEDDFPDARDVYGKTKALGEVFYPHCLTMRTSTIGHELHTKFGLLDWFLNQQVQCKGYARAIFSGLPSVVFSEIIRDIVIPRPELSGLYHVGAEPINKFDLLKLIANVYDKKINIVPDERLIIDRSLDSTRFKLATGYVAPSWPELVKKMHAYR